MNQRQLAQRLGLHFTHISQILSGRRSPGLITAVALERETGIPVEAWLPTGEGKIPGGTLKPHVKQQTGKA